MEPLSNETLQILNRIDAMGTETRSKIESVASQTRTEVNELGKSFIHEMGKVTSEIADVRDRLGKLEGLNRGQDVELRDLKAEQNRLEIRQQEIVRDYEGKIKTCRQNCAIRPQPIAIGNHEVFSDRESIPPKKRRLQLPKYLFPILTAIGITTGGIVLGFVNSCSSEKANEHKSQKIELRRTDNTRTPTI